MLTLPIKQEWFDMICRGEKREEYREATEYYQTRINSAIVADPNCKGQAYKIFIKKFVPDTIQKPQQPYCGCIASSAKAVCANGAQTRTNTTISCKFCALKALKTGKVETCKDGKRKEQAPCRTPAL